MRRLVLDPESGYARSMPGGHAVDLQTKRLDGLAIEFSSDLKPVLAGGRDDSSRGFPLDYFEDLGSQPVRLFLDFGTVGRLVSDLHCSSSIPSNISSAWATRGRMSTSRTR